MNRARKIFVWGAFLAGAVFVTATAAALVFSHLFNAGIVGRDFKTRIEARYHIGASQIRIGFRPFPVVALRAVSVIIPQTLDASVEKVFVHLKVLPLLAGKLAPAKIELLSPVITVRLRPAPAVSPQTTPFQKLQDLAKATFQPRGPLLTELGREAVQARNGVLKIFSPDGRSFLFEQIEIKSAVRRGAVHFQLNSGQSSFWQTLGLKGRVDLEGARGSAVLTLTGANPGKLAGCFNPSASGRVGGYLADFTAALFYTGPGSLRTDFTASAPSFMFGIGPHTMTIKDGFLAGVLLSDARGIKLSISDFHCQGPHLNLSASFEDRYSDGSLFMTLDGRNTDAASVHSLLLAINRKTGGIDRFFEILRQGQVPWIHCSSHANDISDLLGLKKLTLRGSIVKGVVMAPKVDLLVSNVSGDIQIKDGVLTATRISGQTRGSSTQGGELMLALPHDDPRFHLDLPVEADLSELPAVIDHLALNGPFKQELARVSDVTGKTRGRMVIGDNLNALAVKVLTDPFNLSCRYDRFQQSVSLQGSSFEMDGDQIGFSDVAAAVADSTLSVSGGVKGFLGKQAVAKLQMKGRLGPEGNKIAASLAGLPNWIKPVSGMDLLSANLTWENGTKTTFNGKMQISGGPLIETDLVETPAELSIRRLAIKDRNSDAQIALDSLTDGFRIGFSGTLSNKTIDGLLTGNWLLVCPIRGQFLADLYPGSPQRSSCEGQVALSEFRLPGMLPSSATIEKATLQARGKSLEIKSAAVNWEGSKLNFTGSIAITDSGYLLDLNASTDSLDLDRIIKSAWVTRKVGEKLGPLRLPSREKPWDKPLTGVVRVKSNRLSYGKFIWAPAEGDVVINQGAVDIRLTRAGVCGISTPGKIRITPGGADISLDISAGGKHLQSTLACLFNNRPLISGSYELSGHLQAKCPALAGKGPVDPAAITPSLVGNVEFQAKDGRILRFNAFTKVISLLSISEIYRGVLPNLTNKGCKYNTLQLKGTIKNGSLLLSDSILDGPSIKMVFSGQIDLVRRKMNVTALVAPQRTVERVVNATPLVGTVLKDAFVTVPVRISGDLADPSVVLLSPGAIGHELLGVMQRLVKLPFTIFQPLIKNGASKK
ncbi:MAG: AsmA-like C-terminal domain-containing protein [Syntrophobacteraceae bacterium]|nr:AsmA-like C-terminal domain-containing protein [Syntrophobacteraceae bacterium]